MLVLVIPDVHLKYRIFEQADNLLRHNAADRAVCLMDMPDDWNSEFKTELYLKTFDAAIHFAEDHPETLWCWGNHELSYMWHEFESGYSSFVSKDVQLKILELEKALPDASHIGYVQKIDNVLFSHAGVGDRFVREHVAGASYNDANSVVDSINKLGHEEMWQNHSPVWLRPQLRHTRLYKPRKLLQVVGHTPMKKITKKGNLISCDVFSTYSGGAPIGTEEFLLLDTETWDFTGVKG